MARKLNKNLVGVLTLFGMVLLAIIGFVLLLNLPGQNPKLYAADASKLEEEGEYNRAMQTYYRAYKKDPVRNPEYLVKAARCALEDGSIMGARELLDEALVRDSKLKMGLELSAELEFELARLFGGPLQWNRALERATKLVEVDDQSPLAYYALGLAYLNLREDDESYEAKGEKDLKRALELDPTNVGVVESLSGVLWTSARDRRAENKKAEAEALDKAREAMVASAIEKCADLGEEEKVFELKRLQALYKVLGGPVREGLAALDELVKKETTSIDCHILLSNVYAGLYARFMPPELKPDLAKAEKIGLEALEIDPGNGLVYRSLGRLYERQGKFEEEMDLYRRGLEEIPYEKHFRSFRNNRARVDFVTSLVLWDIQRALEAREASDDAERARGLSSAEAWIEKLKEEVHEDSLDVRFLNAHLFNARGDYVAATREAEAASRMTGAATHFQLQRLLAELYVQRNQWGAARKALETALLLRPASPLLRVRLGQVYLKLGQPAAALRLLKPSESGPLRNYLDKSEAAANLRVEAYKQLGQFDQATKELQRGGQDTPEAQLRQAEILLSEGRNDEAGQKIKALLEKEPGNADVIKAILRLYTAANRLDEARSLVKSLLAKDPGNRLYQRWDLRLMEKGDATSRDKLIEEFLVGEEDEFIRTLSFSDFHRSRNRLEEAAKFLDKAEKLRPDSPAVIRRQFRAALEAKDWRRAEKYALRHGELNLDGTEGKIVQGRLAQAKGEFDRAEGRHAMAKEEFDKAIESIKLGLDKYPSYSLGWTYLAEAYLAADRVAQAKNALQKALEVDPTNGYANKKLAEIAIREGDEKAARTYIEAAAKFLPDDPWVERRRQVLEEEENPREGIVSREKIRSEDPKNWENLVLLARLYALPEIGDYDKATEVYREALETAEYNLDLAREVAAFLGRDEVNRPAEGEALLKKLLGEEQDKAKKALIAVYMGQFYETQKALATADRHFRLAVSLDPSLRTLMLAAEFYARTNRYRDALEYYGRALKQTEVEEADAGLAKATRSRIISLLLARGDLEEAKRQVDDYVREYPDDPQGMVFEGAYHRMGGDIQKSKEAFDAFLEKHPDNAVVLWQRGQLHSLMGRWQLAISDLEKAKVFDPDGLGYRHRIALADALIEVGRGDGAIAELRSILEEHPEEVGVAEALVDAYQRVRPARSVDAENLIYTYMRRHPKDLKWPMLLGKLGEDFQDWNKAIQGYEVAAELSRYSSDVMPALFDAYKAAGRPRDIIRFAEEKLSTRLLGRMPEALASLAWAYSQMEEREKCFETYDRALAAAGDDFRAYAYIVTEAIAALGKETVLARARSQAESDPENVDKLRMLVHLLFVNAQHEEAVKVCDQIREVAVRDTERVFAALAQAMLLEQLGQFAEAKAKYEDVLKLDPRQSQALNNLAYLLVEQMDNPAEALPYAEQANRLHPNDPSILDTLGWILARNNRLGEAAGMLLRALEINRDDVAAGYHLGLVHVLRGEPEEAKLRLTSAKADAEAQGDTHFLPKITKALEELGEAND